MELEVECLRYNIDVNICYLNTMFRLPLSIYHYQCISLNTCYSITLCSMHLNRNTELESEKYYIQISIVSRSD